VSDDVRIVLEVKDVKRLNLRSMSAELERAMKNRDAQAGIVVVSSADNTLMGGQRFRRLDCGSNMWAVVMEKDEAHPVALQSAYSFVRTLLTSASSRDTVTDMDEVKRLAEQINRHLNSLSKIKAHVDNIAKDQQQAAAWLITFEHETRTTISQMLQALTVGAPEAGAA
jgi:hypothetical protein